MIIDSKPRTGVFRRRVNRFTVSAEIEGREVLAHLPNSGRMRELLVNGARAAFVHKPADHRKTDYDFVQVEYEGAWVSVDSRLPSRLVVEAFTEGLLSQFSDYESHRMEPSYGAGRFDIEFSGQEGVCLVECKSVNLVENGIALFPDAPTTRGARHLRELAEYSSSGGLGFVIFVVQRSDADVFCPYEQVDPDFASACHEAKNAGVSFMALKCRTSLGEISIIGNIPVELG